MRIQTFNPILFRTYNRQQPQQKSAVNNESYSYNPIAYNDLTFGARLFRTPQNFYVQPFNKNGMPETMKQYLNADYEDRQNMPPAQMLKLVFDDINETKNLEQVKRIFPDEALFKNLTDIPKRNARTGILAEIELMREDGKTLFKNGKDNLGHYILKKIYTESKTLKEINEDFKKDISVHFKDLSPIEYTTLAAYGIKFPNNAFWKSLTATREEFPYEYKPRKPIEVRERTGVSTPKTTQSVPRQRKRFEDVKDWEIDKFTDALTKGNGSIEETAKQLKRTHVRDEASLNFVAKYMGEINSVVIEKLHISPDMKDYFANYDDLSKNQKQKFTEYWQKNPEMNKYRSTIMKDTIKLFFDAYGLDGQNDEFKELIEYAHSIKPNRLAELERHNQIQAEYDEMFKELDEIVEDKTPVLEEEQIYTDVNDFLNKQNIEKHVVDINGTRVVMLGSLKQEYEDVLKRETVFLPNNYVNRYVKFITSHPSITEDDMKNKVLYNKSDIDFSDDEKLELARKIYVKMQPIYEEMKNQNLNQEYAIQQAICAAMLNLDFCYDEIKAKLINLETISLIALYNDLSPITQQNLRKQKSFIENKFNEYTRPVTNSEARKIQLSIKDLIKRYESLKDKNSGIPREVDSVLYTFSKFLNNKKYNHDSFMTYLNNYISTNGYTRIFADKSLPNNLKIEKLSSFLSDFIKVSPQILTYTLYDEEGLEYMKLNDPENYMLAQAIRQGRF